MNVLKWLWSCLIFLALCALIYYAAVRLNWVPPSFAPGGGGFGGIDTKGFGGGLACKFGGSC